MEMDNYPSGLIARAPLNQLPHHAIGSCLELSAAWHHAYTRCGQNPGRAARIIAITSLEKLRVNMARVALPKHEQITDPAVEGIFAWVTEMEGSVPNHFYVELNFPEFFTAKLGATKVLWETGELTMEEI